MHILQQKIIASLIKQPKLRFSDLRPERIESNQFVYHLKSLMRDKLIKKTDNLYHLTVVGKQLAGRLSSQNLRERIQPKIVTMVVCQNYAGEYLLCRRNRQPFLNTVGFPYGKIHLGETIKDAVERELKEKTGLLAKLKYRGDVYLTVYENKELLSQVLCHIFSGDKPVGKLIETSDKGECFWSKLESFKKSELIPGFTEITKLLKNKPIGQLFFGEYVFKLKS